jgi:hypothetical protein
VGICKTPAEVLPWNVGSESWERGCVGDEGQIKGDSSLKPGLVGEDSGLGDEDEESCLAACAPVAPSRSPGKSASRIRIAWVRIITTSKIASGSGLSFFAFSALRSSTLGTAVQAMT